MKTIVDLYKDGQIPSSLEIREALDQKYDDVLYPFALQKEYRKHYSFSLYSSEEIQILAEFIGDKKAVEIGCGSGFLVSLLLPACPKLVGVDNYVSKYFFSNHGVTLDNKQHSVLRTDGQYYLENNKDVDILLLVWPDLHSTIAYDAVESVRPGTAVVYKGEGKGGCTGTDEFHDLLFDDSKFASDYELTRELNGVSNSFYGIHDRWYVYVKL